jgi:hypothetical protein
MEYESMTLRSNDESESSHSGSSGSEEVSVVGRLSPRPGSRSPRFPEDMYDVIEWDSIKPPACIPRSSPRVSSRRDKTEEEPVIESGGSVRGGNFFTCLPAEILENEILRRLSPVGGTALVMACGLVVSAAVRPKLFIRWKHPVGARDNLTLKMEARDPAEKRVLGSFNCKRRETNPSDDVYEAVCDRKIPRISEPRDLAMAIALGCDIENLSVRTPAIWPLGTLMAGQTPNLCDVALIIRYGGSFKDVPEQSFLEYIFDGVAAGIILDFDAERIISNRYREEPIRCCGAVDLLLEKQIAVKPQYGRWSWNNVPIAVYKYMLRSGYMWFLITECPSHCTFSDVNNLRWVELAADILPRIKTFGEYISVDMFGYIKGSRLSRRLGDVIKICGAHGALEMVKSKYNKPYMVQTAMALRGLLGDDVFTWLTTMDNMRVYVASGAVYRHLRAGCGDLLRWCIQYDNPTFLRGYLQDNPTLELDEAFSDMLYRPCFKLGRAECLVILLEHNITISPRRVQVLIASCTSRNIINLFA